VAILARCCDFTYSISISEKIALTITADLYPMILDKAIDITNSSRIRLPISKTYKD
jgi:hypothetical protein